VPDRNLQRAADYLGAAADLLDTRDRRSLTAQRRDADAARITPHLAAAGYLVAATTAAHPALLDTAAEVAVAVRSWEPAPPAEVPADPTAASLVDASRDLRRAADHFGAAAALLDPRATRPRSAEQRAADASQATPHLTAAGYLVATTTAAHPALFDTAAEIAGALKNRQPSSSTQVPAVADVTSLVDASTIASAPSQARVQAARPEAARPDAASSALTAVQAALHRWQQAALAVARDPAPSSSDLLGAARTAGMLTRLAQNLLTAHTDPTQAGDAAAVSLQLRRAGATWNAAADVWRTTATGGRTVSPDVRDAGAALEAAVRAFARTGADWTSPQALRAQASPDLAGQLARTALAATQAVAERHAPLVARLGQTAALYTQARHLSVPETEEPEQRVTDRLTGRFAPMGPGDAAPLVAAYQQLPAATAAARTAYAALTDPAAALHPGRERAAGHTQQRAAAGPQQTSGQSGAVPVTLAGQRWQQTLADVDARLLDDPHYPALAAALDRIKLAGVDVPATLAAAAAQPLPDKHTARALHWHLVDICPAAITPFTDPTGPTRPAVQPAALAAAAAVHRAAPAPTSRR